EPIVDPESGRSSAVRLLAHALRHVVHTNVPEGRVSPRPRVRREPGLGARRARLTRAYAPAVAELAPASQEPPREQMARPGDRLRERPHFRPGRRGPLGAAARPAPLSFRLRVANS